MRRHIPFRAALATLMALGCSKTNVVNQPGDDDIDGSSGGAAGSGSGCTTISCYFPTACQQCLDVMAGVIGGGVDCSKVVQACGANEYEHCRGTVECITAEIEADAATTRDCAVHTCLGKVAEPAAYDFFACLGERCAEVCGVTTGFPCP